LRMRDGADARRRQTGDTAAESIAATQAR
jgi:hypothetical protein